MSKLITITFILIATGCLVVFLGFDQLRALLVPNSVEQAVDVGTPLPPSKPQILELSPEARKNLGLQSQPAVIEDYWRTAQIPGVIVDRPGVTDNAVISQTNAYSRAFVQFVAHSVSPSIIR